jgi:hypothetical protein
MSAIALFVKLPKTSLEGLMKAAIPQKRLFRAPRDSYYDYLRQHGEEVADYQWSGYVFGTLLPYLDELHQIDLMKSEYETLSQSLSTTRRAPHFALTSQLSRNIWTDWLAWRFRRSSCVIITTSSPKRTSPTQATYA